jgi:protocatechuate 3,4-dioxygenase beta subunit
MSHDDHHAPDGGLRLDLNATFSRRRALQMFVGAGAVALLGAGCGDEGGGASTSATVGTTTATTTTGATTATTGAACSDPIPQETAGPFPGDGSNGPNVLNQDGVMRRDIRSSFGGMTGAAEGVALTVILELLDANDGCTPLNGSALYLWHCDRDGGYSLYSSGLEDQNYLRGMQIAGADGTVTFTTIFPGCYPGRWPHLHFEIYGTEAEASNGTSPRATSQLALPNAICETIYRRSDYGNSASNLAQLSLQSDNVFGDDGAVHQIARMSGTADTGLTARLTVPV